MALTPHIRFLSEGDRAAQKAAIPEITMRSGRRKRKKKNTEKADSNGSPEPLVALISQLGFGSDGDTVPRNCGAGDSLDRAARLIAKAHRSLSLSTKALGMRHFWLRASSCFRGICATRLWLEMGFDCKGP